MINGTEIELYDYKPTVNEEKNQFSFTDYVRIEASLKKYIHLTLKDSKINK